MNYTTQTDQKVCLPIQYYFEIFECEKTLWFSINKCDMMTKKHSKVSYDKNMDRCQFALGSYLWVLLLQKISMYILFFPFSCLQVFTVLRPLYVSACFVAVTSSTC